ncbi:hypothetical protein SBFV2_gp11 [Sulfolobales Beppu filamentous virus 2]|uniref:Uncharacterized protein n=1 Tax=Sulfolobales Beppu filamentous virus 2 TaxID=2493123 RepID=A0A3Q8Q3P3_9VIRU|nr:hypothetical protein HOU84_gp11 [Sulfolobales Beppu filamentous virus 2]AZI75778.1 hypothetical protein SBFV2_gp11 [Sulfolobales Beppu filamentous virus 2]
MLGSIGRLLYTLSLYCVSMFYLTYQTLNFILSHFLSLTIASITGLVPFVFTFFIVADVLPRVTAGRLVSGKIVEVRRVDRQAVFFQSSNVMLLILASYDKLLLLLLGWFVLILLIYISGADVSILALNPFLLMRGYKLYYVRVEVPGYYYKRYYILSDCDLENNVCLGFDNVRFYEIVDGLYIMRF